jgi:hypothetical protein
MEGLASFEGGLMTLYADEVFAPIDHDHFLERIAGGNETEVYISDDRRFVVKLKNDLGCDVQGAVDWAKSLRSAAEEFADCLGPRNSIPSYYLVARDSKGKVQVLVVQPFITGARQLYQVKYSKLSPQERDNLAVELRNVIRRSLLMYVRTGSMPDLYGRSSTSSAERKRLNKPHMLPKRLWSFLVKRNLLRSHNLMLVDGPEQRVVLVDYDPVRRSRLYKKIYYTVRWMLFWRDQVLILLMQRSGKAPPR